MSHSDQVRRLPRQAILDCYRRFACPRGVEAHTSIYTQATLNPELFGPEPPFDQVVSVGARAKRPLSDLIDKPLAPRPYPQHATNTRMVRPPRARPPSWLGEDEQTLHDSHEQMNRFNNIDAWAESATSMNAGRPQRPTRVSDTRFSPANNSSEPDWGAIRQGANPHTQASWEKLEQKVASSSSPNKLIRPPPIRPPPPRRGDTDILIEQLKHRFPQGLPEDLVHQLLSNVHRPMPPEQSLPPPKMGPMIPPSQHLTFQELLQKTHGWRPSFEAMHAEDKTATAPLDIEPPADLDSLLALSLADRIVRWSDGRPLYLVDSPSLAERLSQDRLAACQAAKLATNGQDARARLESYETIVSRCYTELLEMRKIRLPPPLSSALSIDDGVSLALWPSFRELFLQSSNLLRDLKEWEESLQHRETATTSTTNVSPWQQATAVSRAGPAENVSTTNVVVPQKQQLAAPMINGFGPEYHSGTLSRGAAAAAASQTPSMILKDPNTVGLVSRLAADVERQKVVQPAVTPPNPIPTAPPPQPPPRQPTPPPATLGVADWANKQWEYLDPSRVIQGPFTSTKMYNWWRRDYFPTDLPVRYQEGASFVPLSALYPPELHSQAEPFKVPPPVITALPLVSPNPKVVSAPPKTASIPPSIAPSPSTAPKKTAQPSAKRPDVQVQQSGANSESKQIPPPKQPPAPIKSLIQPAPPPPPLNAPSPQPKELPQPLKPTPWKKADHVFAPYGRITDEDEDENDLLAGPSLAESRFTTDVNNRDAGARGGRKRAKGKKQALGELLFEQRVTASIALQKSAWASQPQRPPVSAVWLENASGSSGATVQQGGVDSRGNGLEATSPVSPSGAAAAAAAAVPVGEQAAASQECSPVMVVSASSPANEVTVEGGCAGAADSGLSTIQKSEVQRLCSQHGIELDPEVLDVLVFCQSASDISNLLKDNLAVSEETVDSFVEEFWDMVRNPFKPVKKGIAPQTPAAALKVSSSRKKKASKKK